jgi:NAD(P)H-dependent nitrite reductase small subunit
MSTVHAWQAVCPLEDIIPDSGVCADLGGRQVAVFRVDDRVFALDNLDPASGVNVLSRGIVGDLNGETVVASPLYKQHFVLATGRCLEDAALAVATHPARVVDGMVWVRAATRKRRLVVIGNGMAGMRVVEELIAHAPDLYEIDVFGAERHGNYNRILLSPLLAGEKSVADIMLHTPAWYAEHDIRLHAGDPIVAIDRVRRVATSAAGFAAPYDRLLIATGSKPALPRVSGVELEGVLTFRDLDDVDSMIEASRRHARAVVIGGGLLGIEAANALKGRGMDVTVVHLKTRLMDRQLDEPAARLLKASLETRGLKFRMGAQTRAIEGGERVVAVRLEDGESLPADLVVLAIGIRPNIELAEAAGLRCERGVLVDDTMLTFDPSIYAVGECVQHRNSTYGLVAPLWEQARVCAAHLAEIGLSRYSGSLHTTHLKVTGINVFSAGDLRDSRRSESLVFSDALRGVYKRVIIEDDMLRGAVLYGDTSDGPRYLELMSRRSQIGALRESLLLGAEPAAP